MNLTAFWRIIEVAKRESLGNCEKQAQIVTDLLVERSADEILLFDAIICELVVKAERDDLYNASTIFKTSISDDAFEYFRRWLIAQGEEIYSNALRDPDSLVDVVDPSVDYGESECEEIGYAAMEAYELVTGQEMGARVTYSLPSGLYDWEDRGAGYMYAKSSPYSLCWLDADLSTVFPRLWARFGGEAP